MSYREDDRHDGGWGRFGRPGGDWQGLRPSFDNPLSWSLPLLRAGGITVRVHIVFLLFILIVLLRSLVPPGRQDDVALLDTRFVAAGLACLFTIVLTHEFGHCLACRWSGGEASEILMWPLGGLAFCRPPQRWSSHLLTALGGPAVNVLFCAVAGLLLSVQSGRAGLALPRPLSGYQAIAGVNHSWPLVILFLVHWLSLVVLLFNLLPVFPLDGGRIVQAILWRSVGYARSMRLTVRIGYVGAIALGLFGAVMAHWMLIAVAAFGAVTCYLTHRQLQFTQEIMGLDQEGVLVGADEDDREKGLDRAGRAALRRAQIEAEEDRQVDEILAKIADGGMDRLSGRERRLLRRVTERRRRS